MRSEGGFSGEEESDNKRKERDVRKAQQAERILRDSQERKGVEERERIGREGRRKFLVVAEKRASIMCTHSLSLSLSLRPEIRGSAPREDLERAKIRYFRFPAFFTFLSCRARVVSDEILGVHARRGNNGELRSSR